MMALARELASLAQTGRVLTAHDEMQPYLTDWRGRVTGRAACVVLPGSTSEVAQVVSACAARGLQVFPQGGNTSLCYGTVPKSDRPGIVLGLHRMSHIRSVSRSDNSLICDAGVVLDAVHTAAAKVGRQFPLHLGSQGSAQIGGLISTNAGGTGVLRYGSMRDLVLGLEVVLEDGSVWNGLSTLRKDNTAYDLKHLFVGAEGTLGIITGASLKLFPALRARADAWVAVSTPQRALELLTIFQDVFDTRIQAFELLSKSEVEIGLANVPGNRIPFPAAPPWSVLIELGDSDPEAPLKSRIEQTLARALDDGIAADAVVAESGAQAESFWRLRHTLSEANKRHGLSHTHDVSVPVSAVPEFIAAADAMLSMRHPEAIPVVVCHLGDGNVHYIAMFSREDWAAVPDQDGAIDRLQEAVHDIAARFGGSFSAEHGVGRKLVGEMSRLTSPVEMKIHQKLKSALDPACLFNPGVIFK